MWSSQFKYFSIQWLSDIHRMSTDILVAGMSSVDAGVRDDTGSWFIASEVINHHQDNSQISGCVILIIFLGAMMAWFFHQRRTDCNFWMVRDIIHESFLGYNYFLLCYFSMYHETFQLPIDYFCSKYKYFPLGIILCNAITITMEVLHHYFCA